MPYIVIDIEATGPVPPLYSMVSLGAVAVHDTSDGPELGDELYLEIKPAFGGVDDEAMAVHGLTLEHLAAEGLEAEAALERLTGWARAQQRSPDDALVFVAHNAPFDWAYVNYYYRHFGKPNPFGYKALDTKALAMGVLGTTWEETGKDELARRMPEIGPEDKELKHRADYDARYQADLLCALLRRME